VHRDIKPENIMLDQSGSVDSIKLINIETAIKFTPGKPLYEKIGTPYYIAPEVMNKRYGPNCDVWSCGVIAYICLFGKAPFEGPNDVAITKKV
jgi:calcium-dependent protein kinase